MSSMYDSNLQIPQYASKSPRVGRVDERQLLALDEAAPFPYRQMPHVSEEGSRMSSRGAAFAEAARFQRDALPDTAHATPPRPPQQQQQRTPVATHTLGERSLWRMLTLRGPQKSPVSAKLPAGERTPDGGARGARDTIPAAYFPGTRASPSPAPLRDLYTSPSMADRADARVPPKPFNTARRQTMNDESLSPRHHIGQSPKYGSMPQRALNADEIMNLDPQDALLRLERYADVRREQAAREERPSARRAGPNEYLT